MSASVLLCDTVTGDGEGVVRLSVVGRVEVHGIGGRPVSLQPAQRQLLSLLAAAGPHGVSADRLADELWGENLPSRWQASLRMALSRLRKRFGVDCIAAEGGNVRLLLTTEQVDLWALASDETSLDDRQLSDLLEAVQIFPGIEPSRMLTAVSRQVETFQREAILSLEHARTSPSRSVLTRAQGIVERDVLDIELVTCVARLHRRAGLAKSAHEILDHAVVAWTETYGDELPHGLVSLAEQLENEPVSPARPNLSTQQIDRPITLPGGLEMFATHSLFGREAERAEAIAHLDEGRDGDTCGVIVRGRSGAGKTHLASEIARALASDGFNVLYASAVPSAPAAYGPILGCMPELAEIVQRVMSEPDDRLVRARRASIWAASLLALRTRAEGRPLLLVIDDAQWLDSQSSMLVEFFLRSALPSGLAVLIVARSEAPEHGDQVAGLTTLPSVIDVTLDGVDEDALTAMVSEFQPALTPGGLKRAVERLGDLSGGLPGVARIVLKAIDETGAFHSGRMAEASREWAFESLPQLSPNAKALGQIASVLGLEFSVEEVRALSGVDEDSTIDALEELLAQEIVLETHPDRFRFAHILMAEAFRSSLSSARERRLHRDASVAAANAHQRAQHLLGARPLVDESAVVEAVSASATQHLADGAFTEAAVRLRELRVARGGQLTIGENVTLSGVLSLSGAHDESDTERRLAFDRAASEGRWREAVAAALSGLPEAENPAGEPMRVGLLEQAAAQDLPDDLRWELHLELARQAALAGRPTLAVRSSDIALEMASGKSQLALAVLAERGAKPNAHPRDRLERLSLVDPEAVSEIIQPRIYQARAIDLTELGRLQEAAAEHDRFVALAHRTGDPVRVWHALLFSAGEAFNQADEAEFEERREAAHAHGLRHGIATASSAYLAQAFLRLWWRGEAAALEPFFPLDPTAPLLQQAGATVVLAASGHIEKAMSHAVDLTEQVPTDYIALPCAALLAELVGAAGDRAAIDRLRALLEPRCGSGILVGAGFASMGPADRYVAFLADSEAERRRITTHSCELAASWGVESWADESVARVLPD